MTPAMVEHVTKAGLRFFLPFHQPYCISVIKYVRYIITVVSQVSKHLAWVLCHNSHLSLLAQYWAHTLSTGCLPGAKKQHAAFVGGVDIHTAIAILLELSKKALYATTINGTVTM